MNLIDHNLSDSDAHNLDGFRMDKIDPFIVSKRPKSLNSLTLVVMRDGKVEQSETS